MKQGKVPCTYRWNRIAARRDDAGIGEAVREGSVTTTKNINTPARTEDISASTRRLIDKPQAPALSTTWTSNSFTCTSTSSTNPVSACLIPSLRSVGSLVFACRSVCSMSLMCTRFYCCGIICPCFPPSALAVFLFLSVRNPCR